MVPSKGGHERRVQNMFRKNEMNGQELAYSELLEEIAKEGPIFVDDEGESESELGEEAGE